MRKQTENSSKSHMAHTVSGMWAVRC